MKRLLLILLFLPLFTNGQIITTIAGTGTAGYTGDGGAATAAEFNWPCSITFDHYGNMFIPDWRNNVIRKINTSGVITTVAGNGYGAGIGGGRRLYGRRRAGDYSGTKWADVCCF